MEHIYRRRVQFADTDAAGMTHFSRILCYVEEAEHEFLDLIGVPLMENGGWPRVHIHCDYVAPVRAGDTVDVTISPEKIGRSSVEWSFTMVSGGHVVAKGDMKTVRVDEDGKPVELDGEWRIALGG